MDNMETVAPDNTQQSITEQQQEKLLPQSQVNDIVGNAKREAAQRAVENYKAQLARESEDSYSQNQHPSNDYRLNPEEVRKYAEEEVKKHFSQIQEDMHRRSNEELAQRIVKDFSEKIASGPEKYQDFSQVTSDVNMGDYTGVVQLLATHVDNADDVLYHLAQNRLKLGNLEDSFNRRPNEAIFEIKRLSKSLKENQQASQMRTANSPLSQQRPSQFGTDSGRVLSMRDLKAKYKA